VVDVTLTEGGPLTLLGFFLLVSNLAQVLDYPLGRLA
jgi:hypothetical protein